MNLEDFLIAVDSRHFAVAIIVSAVAIIVSAVLFSVALSARSWAHYKVFTAKVQSKCLALGYANYVIDHKNVGYCVPLEQ